MFVEAWIQDCSKQELARRLLSYCAETNEPVTEVTDCGCPGHKLAKVDFLVGRVSNLGKDAQEAKAAQAQAEGLLGSARQERDNLDVRVGKLAAQVDALQAAVRASAEDAADAKAGYADAKQAVSDLQGKLRDVQAAAEEASVVRDTLARVKALLDA